MWPLMWRVFSPMSETVVTVGSLRGASGPKRGRGDSRAQWPIYSSVCTAGVCTHAEVVGICVQAHGMETSGASPLKGLPGMPTRALGGEGLVYSAQIWVYVMVWAC